MTTAKEILTLIENADPSDSDALDEIDAKLHCFLNEQEYERHYIEDYNTLLPQLRISYKDSGVEPFDCILLYRYTRSRDALKRIRPEGWNIDINSHLQMLPFAKAKIYISGGYRDREAYFSPELPAEELAELHAIVQSIEWTRQNEE